MSIVLATAWRPRGERERFEQLLSQLHTAYAGMVVTLPPDAGVEIVSWLEKTAAQLKGWLLPVVTTDWSSGRSLALQKALEISATHVQYADFDRLLRWVEMRPQEWLETLALIQSSECLVIGRTPAAYGTHPQALVQSEAISNRVVSHLLGRAVDVSAGSKGFSRRAVQFLVEYASEGRSLGTDAEWPILLQRAGLKVSYVEVDGLDWEIPDHFQARAASQNAQRLVAEQYDAEALNWGRRMKVAGEIVEAALETAGRELSIDTRPDFDFEAVFDVDDYMYFYGDMLTDESSERQVVFLTDALALEQPMDILDLACGFGRHANRLAALGHRVTGVDLTPGFLEMARQDAQQRGVQVDYCQGDMRRLEAVEAYDRVLMMFTAFGYFEDDENLLVLQNIARALRPGGLLIFDTQNRDVFLKGFLPAIVTEKEGNLMIDRSSFDGLSGKLYNRRIVIRNGVRRDKPFFVRIYNPTEIRDLLHRAGLEPYQFYSDWNGAPISVDARRMIVVARKMGDGAQTTDNR